MLIRIRHRTIYTYDQPVFLEPLSIRLLPRADSYSAIVERDITILPEPSSTSHNLESDGSFCEVARFESRPCNTLEVDSNIVLELEEKNPFDFVLHPPQTQTLPIQYPGEIVDSLLPFMTTTPPPLVRAFASRLMEESKARTVEFMAKLCGVIQSEFAYETRRIGDPRSPEETLAFRGGSCRDFSVLAIAVARAVGFAARFVSGYCFENGTGRPELHAWIEVYLPGGGWRGFDPTFGIACHGKHVALASAATSAITAPIQGTFRGDAQAQMQVSMEYEFMEWEEQKQVSSLA